MDKEPAEKKAKITNDLITWLLENYEYCDGATTKSLSILRYAEAFKENFTSGKPSAVVLGHMIKRIWGDKVKRVKDGPKVARCWSYRNLRWKDASSAGPSTSNATHIIKSVFNSISLNDRWIKLKDNDDKFVLLYNTKLEFNKQRIIHEICVRQLENDKIEATIRSGKITIDMLLLPLNTDGSLEKLNNVMSLIENSKMCSGFSATEYDAVDLSSFPHIQGEFYSTDDGEISVLSNIKDTRILSPDCHIFTPRGGLCDNCHVLKKQCSRKERCSDEFSKYCNNRWLSRDQLLQKNEDERKNRLNAEAREQRLRTKFENEMIELDEEDHEDMGAIFDTIDCEGIPPDMAILWEQQIKNSRKTHKTSYRWHPK